MKTFARAVGLSVVLWVVACEKQGDEPSPAAGAGPPPAAASAPTEQPAAKDPGLPVTVKAADATTQGPSVPALETPTHLSAPPFGAKTSTSGLAWVVLDPGAGESTGAEGSDQVRWHYRSWDSAGKLLFDTYEKGAPKDTSVGRMLAGYRESVAAMKVGERRRVWMPAKLAHRKKKKVSARARRIVDIHLVGYAKAPPAPKDLKRPPKSAKKSSSGLVTRVLTTGKGQRSPLEEQQVEVRYAGWRQKTAECFDFTGPEETATFGAGTVIKGWVEALSTMVEGDKIRVWIPPELAYKGKPSKPQGTLVFDIELVTIIR